jgi:hypothetical protein
MLKLFKVGRSPALQRFFSELQLKQLTNFEKNSVLQNSRNIFKKFVAVNKLKLEQNVETIKTNYSSSDVKEILKCQFARFQPVAMLHLIFSINSLENNIQFSHEESAIILKMFRQKATSEVIYY